MSTITEARRGYDEGLREFMLNMYNHTAAGLGISGLVAWFTYQVCFLLWQEQFGCLHLHH